MKCWLLSDESSNPSISFPSPTQRSAKTSGANSYQLLLCTGVGEIYSLCFQAQIFSSTRPENRDFRAIAIFNTASQFNPSRSDASKIRPWNFGVCQIVALENHSFDPLINVLLKASSMVVNPWKKGSICKSRKWISAVLEKPPASFKHQNPSKTLPPSPNPITKSSRWWKKSPEANLEVSCYILFAFCHDIILPKRRLQFEHCETQELPRLSFGTKRARFPGYNDESCAWKVSH